MTVWKPVPGERHMFVGAIDGYRITQSLDAIMGISEGAVRVNIDGTVSTAPDAPMEPDAWVDADGSESFGDSPWAPLTGHSGQHGYRGPVMHASESIGGGMADHILATPGLYVAIVVEAFDDDGEPSEEPAGWALLHIPAETPPAAMWPL